MQSVGQQIREQRLRLGLKLEEISARSRISFKTLQAIESDDLLRISSPFLYRSFVRQFAEHLKLEYSTLAAAVNSAALSMPQPRMPGEGDAGKTKIAPLPIKGRSRNFRWLYSVASLGLMLVACSSLYGVWQNSKSTWRAELGGLMQTVNSGNVAKAPAAATIPAAVPEPSRAMPSRSTHSLSRMTGAAGSGEPPAARSSPESTTAPPQQETLADSKVDSTLDANRAPSAEQDSSEFRVELSATERSWLSITSDGKQTFSGVLDPEETKVLEGHETARIRTGNAGGISCVFNGKSIGPLGPRGQVRTVVFTRSNYEVLDAPTPIALARFPSMVE